MENSVKYVLAAFVGWLLVGVAHALPEALSRLLPPFFEFLPLTIVANLVTVIGWVATVAFSFLVLMDAWKAFRNRVS